MALVNQGKREINAKIVIFGPESAGKATNLKYVFGKLKPEFRGTLKSMNVQDARMLFFDFTPPGDGNLHGFRVRIHVYTISGRVADPAVWKMVLKGVDGIVFVADRSPGRRQANRDSLDNLAAYLNGYGQSLSLVPSVFQFNKSDLPDALDAVEMEANLNPGRLPFFKASSRSGEGVLQTLLSLVKSVLAGLRGKGLEGVGGGEVLQGMVQAPTASAASLFDQALNAGQPIAPPPVRPQAPSFQAASVPEDFGRFGDEPFAADEAAPAGFELGEFAAGEYAAEELGPDELGPEFQPHPQTQPRSGDVEDRATRDRVPRYQAAEEPLSLELSGMPHAIRPGLFRLPLTIRAGARSKSVVLTLEISLEDE